MKSWLVKILPVSFFILVVLFFFKSSILEGKLPIPADTIVGMYHPWRDFYGKNYPSGIPFKNFLITDPVRQQYVWRQLSIDLLKRGQWPLWNPYQFSGAPLLSNFQSSSFYPLNILFLVFSFNLSWGILILLEPILAGIFIYLYLRNLRLNNFACLLGSIVFAFSGFFIAWMEWGTILHSALWLPLILLSIDKIVLSIKYKQSFSSNKVSSIKWTFVFIFSLVSSFFAGHLQIFAYLAFFSLIYFIARWWQYGRKKNILVLCGMCYVLCVIITAVQWFPSLQLISLSSREFDQINWQQSGWFIPWQNLIQFLVPDFFGNPATLNYWGEWNYGEFVGYIGILPLIFAILAIFWRRDKKTWFYASIALASLILALPTPLAKLPYQLQLSLLSTSQPTRLLFLTDFSLAALTALGFDWFIQCLNDSNQLSKIFKTVLLLGIVFAGLWIFTVFGQGWIKTVSLENLLIAKRNLILPTALLVISLILFLVNDILICHIWVRKFIRRKAMVILAGIFLVVMFDLFRFGWKFTPFTKSEWLFPQTGTIKFLQNQPKPFRFMTTDRRIMPANFATFYKVEDVGGYDPLYLKSYGELVAAWNRGKPDISPFSFNRILTPQDYSSRIADLLNVKYVLSLKEEVSPKLKLVFQEGQTRVYENLHVYPRAFLVYDYKIAKSRQEAINFLFDKNIDLRKTAILENDLDIKFAKEDEEGKAEIISYDTQKIVIKTKTSKPAILILANNFYPGWQAFLDGKGESEKTLKIDFTLWGIIIPEGEHGIEFYPSL